MLVSVKEWSDINFDIHKNKWIDSANNMYLTSD